MASSVTKKREEEQNLKTLRELTAIEFNKKCLECSQRGITYADMNTNGFVCVQCSGFLRGLNPPHRVKSISMTTFSQAEIEALKNGGNEAARRIWLGKWNSKRDREPDKSDESAFKNFLIAKYERKSWYVDPKDLAKEETKTESKPEPKLNPPPSTKTTATAERPRGGSTQPQPTPQAATTPAPQVNSNPPAAAAKSVDLLGELQGDPFAAKTPVGGVSVLPPGGFKQDDFGAFTGATQTPAASVATTTTQQPPAALSGNDKYAALASLDDAFRDLKPKDEPPQNPSPAPLNQPAQQGFGAFGNSNPFGGSSQGQVSNPFSGQAVPSQSQPGVPQQGSFGNQGQFGGGFGGQPTGQFGIPQQQPFTSQPGQFGNFGQQQQPQQTNPYMQAQQQQQWQAQQSRGAVSSPGQQWGTQPPGQAQQKWPAQTQNPGGFAQQPQTGFPQQQPQGFGQPPNAFPPQNSFPQQNAGFGQQQARFGQQGGFPAQQQGFGSQQPTQQSGFRQQGQPQPGFGGQSPQAGFRGFPAQQSQQQPGFPAQQSQQQPGFPAQQSQQQPGFPAQQSQQQPGFPAQQSQQQPGFPTQQSQQQPGFGAQKQSGFASFPQQQSKQQAFPQNSLTTTQSRTPTTPNSTMGWSSTTPTSTAGWSSDLSKPPPQSTWGMQPQQPAPPTGGSSWSTGLVTGQQQTGGWGGFPAQGGANWGQPPTQQNSAQSSANPFAASGGVQSNATNPFL